MYQNQPPSQFSNFTGNGLPYDPTRLIEQRLMINQHNPPYVPDFVCNPEIKPYLPWICAGIIGEIQNHAQSNPLRTFMYNQVRGNNYCNGEFTTVVGTIVEYIEMMMAKRQFQTIEQAIERCIPYMLELYCAVNLRVYQACQPALVEFIRPINGMEQSAIAAVAEFDAIGVQMQQYKQYQAQSGGFGGFNIPQPRAQLNTQQIGGIQPMGNAGGGWRQSAQPTAIGDGRFETNLNPDRYARARTPAQQQQPQVTTPQNLFGNTAMNSNVAITPTVQAPSFVEVSAAESIDGWPCSSDFPYYLAHNPFQFKLFYRTANGVTEPILKEIPKMLDAERHKIPTGFGTIPVGLRTSPVPPALVQEALKVANKDLEESAPIHATELIVDMIVFDNSLSAAWANVDLKRRSITGVVKPDIFRMYIGVTEPIILDTDHREAFTQLATATTWLTLREKLLALVNKTEPLFWNAINLRITERINRLLLQGLSIAYDDLHIGDFVADFVDLLEVLETNHGKNIKDALLVDQDVFIARVLEDVVKLAPGVTDDMTNNLMDGIELADDKKPFVTWLASVYSLTRINCSSHELEVQFQTNIPAMLTPRQTPLLHELAKGIMLDSAKREMNCDHFLIQTNDGRVLEVSVGQLNQNALLISLIK